MMMTIDDDDNDDDDDVNIFASYATYLLTYKLYIATEFSTRLDADLSSDRISR